MSTQNNNGEVEIMSDMDESKASMLYSRFQASEKKPKLVQWLNKAGIAKTDKQATTILISITVACVLITLFVIFRYII